MDICSVPFLLSHRLFPNHFSAKQEASFIQRRTKVNAFFHCPQAVFIFWTELLRQNSLFGNFHFDDSLPWGTARSVVSIQCHRHKYADLWNCSDRGPPTRWFVCDSYTRNSALKRQSGHMFLLSSLKIWRTNSKKTASSYGHRVKSLELNSVKLTAVSVLAVCWQTMFAILVPPRTGDLSFWKEKTSNNFPNATECHLHLFHKSSNVKRTAKTYSVLINSPRHQPVHVFPGKDVICCTSQETKDRWPFPFILI